MPHYDTLAVLTSLCVCMCVCFMDFSETFGLVLATIYIYNLVDFQGLVCNFAYINLNIVVERKLSMDR